MNPGEIWWGQIGNSLRFLTSVTNTLRDCHSAVLQVPQTFPWRQEFYAAVDVRRAGFCAERRLVRLPWEGDEDPGAFVLNEFCTSRTRADYWPGQSYAAYLASKDDIVLNDYYVWIAGIHNKADIVKWADFVSQYSHYSDHTEQRAIFILEYDGPGVDTPSVDRLVYNVENYDCRVFALEASSDLANTNLRNYQAELAICVSGGNPELCYELLAAGNEFLKYPNETTTGVIAKKHNSNGTQYAPMSEMQIQSATWEASIVFLFPILERYRMEFVKENSSALKLHLPINNSNGDSVTDPFDLEIGILCYITSNDTRHFADADIVTLRLCRKIRNLLAHNKTPSYSDILHIPMLR